MRSKRAGWLIGGVIAGTLGVFSGCTTNIYHVLKTENHFYIIPVAGDPGEPDGGEEVGGGALTVLTRGGTNFLVVPERQIANGRRHL